VERFAVGRVITSIGGAEGVLSTVASSDRPLVVALAATV
jgi:hypothetical protein